MIRRETTLLYPLTFISFFMFISCGTNIRGGISAIMQSKKNFITPILGYFLYSFVYMLLSLLDSDDGDGCGGGGGVKFDFFSYRFSFLFLFSLFYFASVLQEKNPDTKDQLDTVTFRRIQFIFFFSHHKLSKKPSVIGAFTEKCTFLLLFDNSGNDNPRSWGKKRN